MHSHTWMGVSLNSLLCRSVDSVWSDACHWKHCKMLTLALCATGVALFIYFIHKWLTAYHEYFEKFGLRHMKPAVPFGNTFGFYFGQYTGPEFLSKIYNQFPDEKWVLQRPTWRQMSFTSNILSSFSLQNFRLVRFAEAAVRGSRSRSGETIDCATLWSFPRS